MNNDRISKINLIVKYIISFLLGNIQTAEVVYSKRPSTNASITIIASSFFDEGTYLTAKSIPDLPLQQWHGIPLLFGSPREEMVEGRLIIYADIVASSFFLLTRYEECVNRKDRDIHGRFTGRLSLPGKAGFLERPLVDEYSRQLQSCMRTIGIDVPEIQPDISHIYLTHDVDQIWQWDNLFRAVRTFSKKLLYRMPDKTESLRAWMDYKKWDKIYTFPYFHNRYTEMLQQVGADKISEIYFLKGGGNTQYDNLYYKNKKRIVSLIRYLQCNDAFLGLHASYSAGENPTLIAAEKEYLEKLTCSDITMNRNHYLDSREPEDMEFLIRAGIKDDFTMGYADAAGFRIGTSRPVQWINPKKLEITDLTLHPMTVMDCTLDAKNYMGLNYDEAYETVKQLLIQIKQHNGEVVLLWHNTSVANERKSYQRILYDNVLQLLLDMI